MGYSLSYSGREGGMPMKERELPLTRETMFSTMKHGEQYLLISGNALVIVGT